MNKITSIQIDTEIRNELRKICQKKHLTYNGFLRRCLDEFFESYQEGKCKEG